MSLISSMNPTAPINTRPEAIAAARASAIALGIGVAWGIVGVIYLMTAGAAVMEAALADAAAQSPDAAAMPGMAGMVSGMLVGWTIFTILFQIVMGLVQWFKPNVVVPIILTVLVVLGLGTAVLNISGSSGNLEAMGPLWFVVLNVIVLIVELVLHIAGIRGASALSKINRAEMPNY